MNYKNLSLDELQRLGKNGDKSAIFELGDKLLDFDFCFGETKYCEHLVELRELEERLENEILEECPHCGEYIHHI